MRARLLWSSVMMLSLAQPGCSPKAPASQEEPSQHRARARVPLMVLNDSVAVCRSAAEQPLPSWAKASPGEFFSTTRTRDELSIIITEKRAPLEARCERNWRLIMVKGPLDFNQVGIIAGLSGTLADAGVSIFALSTYDTDYVMVKQADLGRSLAALRQARYTISEP